MGIIGDGDIEVVMVAAVLRVAVVIMSNLSICMFGGGICGVGRGSGVNSGCGGLLFLTTTTTTTTITTSFIAIQHTLKYCTPGDGGDSCICWVVMEVVVMVGYWW